MADKKFIKFLLILLLALLFWPCQLFSQEAENSYYVVENEKGEEVIVQRFTWEGSPYALKYDFVIQVKNKKNLFVDLEKRETTEAFVEVTLPAGNYRYMISVTNLLGVMEYQSEWVYVDIIKAYQPKISFVSPENIYLEEVQDGIFTVTGSDFQPESQFYLTDSTGNRRIPLKVLENDGRKVKLYANPDLFASIKYTLVAKNPGGLTDRVNPISIQFKKPVDFDFSFGYICPIILFDTTFKDY
nr:hypothetical protein [Treponemataceae bacterium]